MADGDIDSLIDQHGEDTVRKAFWLQQHIFEQGLAGVHFSKAAEKEMEQLGPLLIKKAIEDEFTRNI